MGYFWLNYKRGGEYYYRNKEGEIYHYTSGVSGSSKLSKGDKVVFYDTSKVAQQIFAIGHIEQIKGYLRLEQPSDIRPADEIPRTAEELAEYFSDYELNEIPPPEETEAEYFAEIGRYTEISPPIDVHELEDEISFLKKKSGIRGIPQVSIYEIDEDDFVTIIEHSGLKDEWISDS